jgi:chromate transporter
MAAIVFRSAHKIGEFALRDHTSKEWDWGLAAVAALAAFETVLNVNFFIAKVHLVGVYLAYRFAIGYGKGAAPSPLWRAILVFWTIAPLLVFIGVIGAYGKLDQFVPMGVGVALKLGNTQGAQFVVGTLAGLVTFGGAYTAVPFVQYEAVESGAWVVNQTFLDSLAMCSVLPTPLVMFILMVGYMSGVAIKGAETDGLIGAALMTLGMFLPAFALPVLCGETIERAVGVGGYTALVLDAVAATVVGQIAITALVLLRTAVVVPTDAVIFFAALHTMYGVAHKFTPVLVVAAAAMAGQVLYF